MQQVPVHFNKPQIRSMIVDAPEEWGVMARGTGKTKGIIAPKSTRYVTMMPRCTGVFVAATFQQLLTRTLPPVIAGWERLGYKNGVHFLVGQKPTETWKRTWNWQGPYHMPFNFEYFISWFNGAGIQMISQDRAGSSNGTSIDWIMGDEAKLLSESRLKEELFPANRGIHRELVNNPHHHGKTFTTDVPIGTAGRWIFEKENEMNRETLAAIITLQIKVYDLKQKLKTTTSANQQASLHHSIAHAEKLMNVFRRGFVYYHEASILDNIDAVGIEYVKEEMRSLSKFLFLTSMLNKRPYKVEDGFYPALNEDYHGYFAYDYHQHENIGYNFALLSQLDDSRKDADVNHNEPLHMAWDFNRRIWPVVTGQPVIDASGTPTLRTLSAIHVLAPKGIEDALDKWANYYLHHKRKVVCFWYDHTALGETRKPIRDDIVEGLRKRGWVVIECYIGQTVGHETRYTLAHNLLSENGKTPWQVRFNRDNCKFLLLSMYQTQAEERHKGYGKHKQPERDKKFPAEEAPHFGDAWDTLMYGICYSDIQYADSLKDFFGFQVR